MSAADAESASAGAATAPAVHPTPHKHRPIPQLLHLQGTKKRLVIGMVGLPARGKTYTARKLCRYLNWIGYTAGVFNVGTYRRRDVGNDIPASFFDPHNAEGVARRNELARLALDDMFAFLGPAGHGQAAIYDGTNCTLARRRMVTEYIKAKEAELDITVQLIWIEMVCTDPTMILENIREAKVTSPDSRGFESTEQAIAHFEQRIREYEKQYEGLGSDPAEQECSYMRNINCGQQVLNNRIEGYLMSKIAFFVMNLKINRAPIYISRHGESQYNVKGYIGGDPDLSPNGVRYAEALAAFIASEKEITRDELSELSVWTSTLKRTLQTAEKLKPLGLPMTHWRALIEIQVGSCDGMTYAEIEEKFPEEFAARKRDKLNYRYPHGGESYMDVIHRIEPCILELERISTPVLLVVHRAVARCFYAYFLDNPQSMVPHLDVPLHSVLKLTPKAYGCDVTRYNLPVPSCENESAASPPPTIEEQQRALEAALANAAPGTEQPTTASALQATKETHVQVTPSGAQIQLTPQLTQSAAPATAVSPTKL